MLSEQTIKTVKSTIPVLAGAGVAVTEHFYARMFKHNPELKDIFNMSNQAGGTQAFALFSALAAYATYIDDLEKLGEMVQRIANKHVSLNIQPDHYAIVGEHLLATLQELAPEAFTDEVTEAWKEAYMFLADIFINTEHDLYTQQAQSLGGWKGERDFTVVDKIQESDVITSFVFAPTDGGKVSHFTPGQFITVMVDDEQFDNVEMRQYSLSNHSNGEQYQISVKRESQPVPGKVSNFLHTSVNKGDTIKLLPPAGHFVLHEKDTPAVLMSAGVGITPMMAMLKHSLNEETPRQLHFYHASLNQNTHAFRSEVLSLLNNNDTLDVHFWYEQGDGDQNTSQGFMDLSPFQQKLPIHEGDFYLCGPVPFMKFCKAHLESLGVRQEQIHYEVFGPHNDL